MSKDIVVLGGGPGGYVAAIRAAQLGANVCIIEKDSIGGTCLNRGCIPTKTLYRNAEILNTLKHIDDFGISVSDFSFDVEKIQERKNTVINQLVSGIAQLLKANNIEVISGVGTIKNKNTVTVTLDNSETLEISTKNIIIATGSEPFIPPIPGIDSEGVFTSEEILNFTEVPKSLTIIGGGVIGMEFACIFNAMGSDVTVVEYLPNILAQVDVDLTKRLIPSLKKRGITIHASSKVTKVEKDSSSFTLHVEGKKGDFTVSSDKILASVGRAPNTHNLGLEQVGVNFDKKGIKTDANFETNVPGIYAIGDVNGRLMLAHAASHQGISVAEKIMGIENPVSHNIVPSCIFIFPEIATVGMSENEVKEKEIEYTTSKFMFGANGKALSLGEPEGFVKIISSKETDCLLGVHIMGPHASDLIHEATLAICNNLKVKDIINTIHAHPTLSEAFSESVMGLHGEAIHMAPRRK